MPAVLDTTVLSQFTSGATAFAMLIVIDLAQVNIPFANASRTTY